MYPDDERPDLFPYQQTGAEWLAGRQYAYLMDTMGLGKTAQAITAADLINAERILVICPAIARINWAREFTTFSNQSRECAVHTAGQPPTALNGICVTSYDLVTKNVNSLNRPWDLVILDEAHYLKEPSAARTRSVFGKDGIVRGAARVYCLSGTPAPNHPGELWPVFYTFGWTPYIYDDFIERYCVGYDAGYGWKPTGARVERLPELREVLSQHSLRRRTEEVMSELPPIRYDQVVVEAGEVDIDTADSFVQYVFPKDRRAELEDELNRQRQTVDGAMQLHVERHELRDKGFGNQQLRTLESLSDSVATLRRWTGLQKVENTAAILADELKNDAYDKIVVFAVHRDVIEGLRERLKKHKPVVIYGGTNPEKRQRHIDRFQNDPKCRVFIGNIQAAGVAVTLTAACEVAMVEQSWVPGENAQAVMRCHRIGQERPVRVRIFNLADSFDESVGRALKRKVRELTKLFDE